MLKQFAVFLVTITALVAAAASSGSLPEPEDPEAQCRVLCDAACVNLLENCDLAPVGEEEEFIDACIPSCEDTARCDEAFDVQSSYDECIELLDGERCRNPDNGTFPNECENVILTR